MFVGRPEFFIQEKLLSCRKNSVPIPATSSSAGALAVIPKPLISK